MIDAIVFLGNYGKEYEKTRHNVAWIFAEMLEMTKNLTWQNKFNAEYAKVLPNKRLEPLHIIKPLTYMNLSGISVASLCSFHKTPPSSILVVHDEVELPLATISLKYGGGLAGHNGLRSIKEHLGTQEFWRLRIGIGRPAPKSEKNIDMAGYVLSRFSGEELSLLSKSIKTVEEIFSLIEGGEDLQSFLKKYAKVKVEADPSQSQNISF